LCEEQKALTKPPILQQQNCNRILYKRRRRRADWIIAAQHVLDNKDQSKLQAHKLSFLDHHFSQ